jgi:hypothetical protein
MAEFNPVPLLRNPRFKTHFKVRRTTVVVDDDGIAVPTPADLGPFEGVVIPSGALGMTRTAESERQAGGITVYCEEPLSLGDPVAGTSADIVLWPIDRTPTLAYQVDAQDDWFDFGFNVAQCSLIEAGGRSAI